MKQPVFQKMMHHSVAFKSSNLNGCSFYITTVYLSSRVLGSSSNLEKIVSPEQPSTLIREISLEIAPIQLQVLRVQQNNNDRKSSKM
jgi:hypothetical protein